MPHFFELLAPRVGVGGGIGRERGVVRSFFAVIDKIHMSVSFEYGYYFSVSSLLRSILWIINCRCMGMS